MIAFSMLLSLIPAGTVHAQHGTYSEYEFAHEVSLQDSYSLIQLSEALNEIGLYISNFDSIQYGVTEFQGVEYLDALHIDVLAKDEPFVITSSYDVDLLLEAIRVASNLNLTGVSWDTSIEEAVSLAGLHEYLITGIREITQYARQEALMELAEEFTYNELVEMGIFMSAVSLDEFQDLGFFTEEIGITPFQTIQYSIGRRTLSSTIWRSSQLLNPGNRVQYLIEFEAAAGVATEFATGINWTTMSQGVGLYRSYFAAINFQTASRIITAIERPGFFAIQPGGSSSFVINGTYWITR